MTLIQGNDPSNIARTISVDANGDLIFSPTGPILLSQPITIQSSGGNKPLSFESTVLFQAINNALPAGQLNFTSTAVPASKADHIGSMSARYSGTIANVSIYFGIYRAGNTYYFRTLPIILSGGYIGIDCDLWMAAGDQIIITITNATLNDTAVVNANGYRMTVP